MTYAKKCHISPQNFFLILGTENCNRIAPYLSFFSHSQNYGEFERSAVPTGACASGGAGAAADVASPTAVMCSEASQEGIQRPCDIPVSSSAKSASVAVVREELCLTAEALTEKTLVAPRRGGKSYPCDLCGNCYKLF